MKFLCRFWDWLRGRREPELPPPSLADLEWDVRGVTDNHEGKNGDANRSP